MGRPQDGFNWGDFLRRPLREAGVVRLSAANAGKTILLTGAGGSIGSALARAILASGPRLLLLLDHSEHNLHHIHTELAAISGGAPSIPILGDVCDDALLANIFAAHRPDTVYHAAAFKHVPLMETNPLAAVRNNALGTYKLATAAIEHRLPHLIMVSTDKAVNPHSVMGASKRIAELILLALSHQGTPMRAVRLGNVLGSQGSVVPRFLQQIVQGGPVTVTHPEVSRYFLTLLESVEVILQVASLEDGGGIFLPELGQPVKILDLAGYLIRNAGFVSSEDVSIVFTGLRPGDKMKEDLISECETLDEVVGGKLHQVKGPEVRKDELEAALARIAESVRRRDVAALLEQVRRVVPEYQPSSAVLELLDSPLTGARKP